MYVFVFLQHALMRFSTAWRSSYTSLVNSLPNSRLQWMYSPCSYWGRSLSKRWADPISPCLLKTFVLQFSPLSPETSIISSLLDQNSKFLIKLSLSFSQYFFFLCFRPEAAEGRRDGDQLIFYVPTLCISSFSPPSLGCLVLQGRCSRREEMQGAGNSYLTGTV